MAKQALKKKPLARGILAAVMAAALGCGLLAGCSSNNASTQPADNKSASTEQASDEFQSNIMFCGSTSAYPIISSLASSFTDQYETWNKVDASFPEKNVSIYVAPAARALASARLRKARATSAWLPAR